LNREEVQGKYKISVRGNDQNTNPQVKIMKAQQILMAITNPLFQQSGIITPIQQANGLKRFYQALDVEQWEELINMQPRPPMMPPPGADIRPRFDDLTDVEQAQVLAGRGVKPDIQGRALKSQAIIQEKSKEQEGMDIENLSRIADMISVPGGESAGEVD